jgi:hypothetical protein
VRLAQPRDGHADTSCARGHRSVPEPRAPVWLLGPGDLDQENPMKKIASLLSTTGVLVALVAVCEAAVKWV